MKKTLFILLCFLTFLLPLKSSAGSLEDREQAREILGKTAENMKREVPTDYGDGISLINVNYTGSMFVLEFKCTDEKSIFSNNDPAVKNRILEDLAGNKDTYKFFNDLIKGECMLGLEYRFPNGEKRALYYSNSNLSYFMAKHK